MPKLPALSKLTIVLALVAWASPFDAQESDTAALRQTFAEAAAAYLGVVVDDSLYFVADSSGGAFRKAKGDLASATLAAPPVLKLKLE